MFVFLQFQKSGGPEDKKLMPPPPMVSGNEPCHSENSLCHLGRLMSRLVATFLDMSCVMTNKLLFAYVKNNNKGTDQPVWHRSASLPHRLKRAFIFRCLNKCISISIVTAVACLLKLTVMV